MEQFFGKTASVRLKKTIDIIGRPNEILLPNDDVTSGCARLWSGELFDGFKRHARQSNEKNWRDPIGHTLSKTKHAETDKLNRAGKLSGPQLQDFLLWLFRVLQRQANRENCADT